MEDLEVKFGRVIIQSVADLPLEKLEEISK